MESNSITVTTYNLVNGSSAVVDEDCQPVVSSTLRKRKALIRARFECSQSGLNRLGRVLDPSQEIVEPEAERFRCAHGHVRPIFHARSGIVPMKLSSYRATLRTLARSSCVLRAQGYSGSRGRAPRKEES